MNDVWCKNLGGSKSSVNTVYVVVIVTYTERVRQYICMIT